MFKFIHFGLKKYTGSVLIELMLAVVIGLLLIGFLMEMYLASQRSHDLQTALYQIQDNARMAINYLKTDIHQAGHIGCSRLTRDFMVGSYLTYSVTKENRVRGSDTDMVVRHAELPAVVLLYPMSDYSTLVTSDEKPFSISDILMIADCKHAEIFQVKAISSSHRVQKIITTSLLQYHYEPFAEVSRLAVNKYFIAQTNRQHQDGTPVYSLFVQTISQRKTELVEGIRHMQIRYAINQGGRVTERAAAAVEDWSQVIGIDVELTMDFPPVKKIWHMYAALNAG